MAKGIARVAGIYQSTGGKYTSDNWSTCTLQPGDRVWGGTPWPTKFFTDWATIAEYCEMGYSHAIWDALQVAAHESGTVRGGMAEYQVLYAFSTPCARCLANTRHGSGGGFQYIIDQPQALLMKTGHEITFHDSLNGVAPAFMF